MSGVLGVGLVESRYQYVNASPLQRNSAKAVAGPGTV